MGVQKIKVCVIEDEHGARTALEESINNSKEFQVIGSADSVESGLATIFDKKPDLIFLDIKLIGGDAFMILNQMHKRGYDIPPIVINTAHREFKYAQTLLNEYKEEIIVILEKPFWEDWEKHEKYILRKYYEKVYKNSSQVSDETIKIRTRSTTFILRVKDIRVIETYNNGSKQNRTKIITDREHYVIRKSLRNLHDELPWYFVRINRTTIVNFKRFYNYDHSEQIVKLYDCDTEYGVGNSYKDEFLKLLDRL